MKNIKERDIIKGIIVQKRIDGVYFLGKMIGYKVNNKYYDLISKKYYALYEYDENRVKTYDCGTYVSQIVYPFKNHIFSRTIRESELNNLVKKYIDEYNLEQERIKSVPYSDDILMMGYEKVDYTDDPDVNKEIYKCKQLKKKRIKYNLFK